MPKSPKRLRTAVIRLTVPSWVDQRSFVKAVNQILGTASPCQWNRIDPRTQDYQRHRAERLFVEPGTQAAIVGKPLVMAVRLSRHSSLLRISKVRQNDTHIKTEMLRLAQSRLISATRRMAASSSIRAMIAS